SRLPKVIDYLESEGLFNKNQEDNETPDDITKQTIEFPSSRSERLQSLTRGQTGAVTALGYAEIRGYGYSSHPNIGEVRVGKQPVHIDPFGDGDEYFIGDVELTEVDAFMPADGDDTEQSKAMEFQLGCGLVFGPDETK